MPINTDVLVAPWPGVVHANPRRKRLIFRCWHRGTQESDLLLGSFADSCLADLDETQLSRFEGLLDCSDPELFDWILSGCAPPTEHDHDVLRLLRTYWVRRNRVKLDDAVPSIEEHS